MNRLDTDAPLPREYRGGIIALGNFDGFHLGHQAVVGRALEQARAQGRPALVATFDPHPGRYFRPERQPFQLTTLDQRLRLMSTAGVDGVLVLHFDAALAAVTPESFVQDWLSARFDASGVVTGDDFTFGRQRSGTVASLAMLGTRYGIRAQTVAPVSDAQGVISSTRIRAALESGAPEAAAAMLTRPYTIEGFVSHGDKRGREIGFPTANIDMGAYQRPAYGIYAVRCRLEDGRVVDGAANLGVRPMFDPPKELLEVHLFDFSGDLYGQRLSVELRHYLRPEARFDGLDALIRQMDADCVLARQLLAA